MRSSGRCVTVSTPVCSGRANIFAVFCNCQPPRRALSLRIRRGVVFAIFATAPLLLNPHIHDATTISTHLGTARGVRARMPDNSRKWRATPVVLQDARLALHIRAHIALGPPARDARAIFIRTASELQRRRARRRRHVARALWSRLVVGPSGVAEHAGGAGVCHVLVWHGDIRPL